MDEAIIRFYRRLLRTGFQYAGSIEKPSVFLDTVGEDIRICGSPTDYLHLFMAIEGETVGDCRYLCTCDPAANVAVEILCGLAIGRTLPEVEALTEDSFFQALGSASAELRPKAKGLLQLLDRGVARYRNQRAGSAWARGH